MIHKAKDLSPDQKAAIERLLGRAIAENERNQYSHDRTAAVTGLAQAVMGKREAARDRSAFPGRGRSGNRRRAKVTP
jgi:hypothetical protein